MVGLCVGSCGPVDFDAGSGHGLVSFVAGGLLGFINNFIGAFLRLVDDFLGLCLGFVETVLDLDLGFLEILLSALGGGETFGNPRITLLECGDQRRPDKFHADPDKDREGDHLSNQRCIKIHVAVLVSVDSLRRRIKQPQT